MSAVKSSEFQTFRQWRQVRRGGLVRDYILAQLDHIKAFYADGLSQAKLAAKMEICVKTSSVYFKAARARRVDLGFENVKNSTPKVEVPLSLKRPDTTWKEWLKVKGNTPSKEYLATVKPYIIAAYEAGHSGRAVAAALQISQSQLGLNDLSRPKLGFPKFALPEVRTDYPPCPYVWTARPAGQSTPDYLMAIKDWIITAYAADLSQSMVANLCGAPHFSRHVLTLKLTRRDLGFLSSAAGMHVAALEYERDWSARDDYLIRRGFYIGTPRRAVQAQIGCCRNDLTARCQTLNLGRVWPSFDPIEMRRRADEFDRQTDQWSHRVAPVSESDFHDFDTDENITKPLSGRIFVKPRD